MFFGAEDREHCDGSVRRLKYVMFCYQSTNNYKGKLLPNIFIGSLFIVFFPGCFHRIDQSLLFLFLLHLCRY